MRHAKLNGTITAILLLTASLFLGSLIFTKTASADVAYNGAELVDNPVFLDAASMGSGQTGINNIQSFLSGKGSFLASYTSTFECSTTILTNQQTINAYASAGAPCGQTVSAATIIYYASQVYGISPKVALATMQKEQGIVTAPTFDQYKVNYAMGYGCPDSGGCSATPNSNFLYQLDNGDGWLRINYERALGNLSYWFQATSWTCGSAKNYYTPSLYPNQNVTFYDDSGVAYATYYIANAATSSMYCYTPHAYNNPQGLYGLPALGTTGSYYSGSYNFVKFYTSWFGSPLLYFVPLDDPRWMQLSTDTYKIHLQTGETFDPLLASGRQIYFVDKAYLNGQWYLRTQFDKTNGNMDAIPLSDISEISPSPITPKWVSLSAAIPKIDPLDNRSSDSIPEMTATKVVDEVTVNGTQYYRSAFDHDTSSMQLIPVSSTEDFKFYNLISPRLMVTNKDTRKVNVQTGALGSQVLASSVLYLNQRITIGGELYLQVQDDNGTLYAIKNEDLSEITNLSSYFVPLDDPRWMQLSTDTSKVHLQTNQAFDPVLSAGRQIYFLDKIYANGQWYLRTEYDKAGNNYDVIPLSIIEEIPITSITPKWVSVPSAVAKVDPLHERTYETVADMTAVNVVDTITVNGTAYYRTAYEQSEGQTHFIPVSSTEDFKFYNFITPRTLVTNKATHKIDVQTGQSIQAIASGTRLSFDRRITINGTLYAQVSTDHSTTYAISMSDLNEVN